MRCLSFPPDLLHHYLTMDKLLKMGGWMNRRTVVLEGQW